MRKQKTRQSSKRKKVVRAMVAMEAGRMRNVRFRDEAASLRQLPFAERKRILNEKIAELRESTTKLKNRPSSSLRKAKVSLEGRRSKQWEKLFSLLVKREMFYPFVERTVDAIQRGKNREKIFGFTLDEALGFLDFLQSQEPATRRFVEATIKKAVFSPERRASNTNVKRVTRYEHQFP